MSARSCGRRGRPGRTLGGGDARAGARRPPCRGQGWSRPHLAADHRDLRRAPSEEPITQAEFVSPLWPLKNRGMRRPAHAPRPLGSCRPTQLSRSWHGGEGGTRMDEQTPLALGVYKADLGENLTPEEPRLRRSTPGLPPRREAARLREDGGAAGPAGALTRTENPSIRRDAPGLRPRRAARVFLRRHLASEAQTTPGRRLLPRTG